jgi:hypothetical protein
MGKWRGKALVGAGLFVLALLLSAAGPVAAGPVAAGRGGGGGGGRGGGGAGVGDESPGVRGEPGQAARGSPEWGDAVGRVARVAREVLVGRVSRAGLVGLAGSNRGTWASASAMPTSTRLM